MCNFKLYYVIAYASLGWEERGDLAVSRLGGGRAGSTLSTTLKTGALTAGSAGALCLFIVPGRDGGLVAVV